MMLDKLILGKKIKEARQRTGLNQSKYGKKIGISKQALSSIERGLYWPELDTLENISSLCGLTLNDFSDKFSTPYKILEERERSITRSLTENENLSTDSVCYGTIKRKHWKYFFILMITIKNSATT